MKTISNLPSLSALGSGDSLALVQGSNTYKATLKQIKELFSNDPGLNKTFNFSGNLLISGKIFSTGDITSSGNVRFGKSSSNFATIIGDLNQSGNVTVSGNVNITGGLGVTGDVNLGRNSASNIQVSGNLKVVGATYNYGEFSNVGNFKLTGNIEVTGSGKFGTPGRPNTFLFNGLTTVDHSGIFNSGIKSLGLITGSDNLYIAGNIAAQKILGVSGDSIFGQTASNTFIVNSTSTYNAPALFQNTLNAASDVGIVGNLRVSGDTYLGNSPTDTITLAGKTVFNRLIEVSGGITVTGNVVISGHLLANQSGFIRSGLNVGDQLFVSGKTFLGNAITNHTYIQGSGFVSGHLVVHGNLNVSGTALFPNGIQDDTQKKCMFDPQVKVGLTNGIYFDSGVGVNKLVFLFHGTVPSTRTVKWDTTAFEAGDVVYVSGVIDRDDVIVNDTVQAKLHGAYNGFFNVSSTFNDIDKKGMYLNPTGLPISPPSNSHNGQTTGWVPYILVHYKSGWLNNVSGIVPVRGSVPDLSPTSQIYTNLEKHSFHHKIVFNRPFSNSNYISLFSCNQGTGFDKSVDGNQNDVELIYPSALKIVNVSYMDSGSRFSKTIFTNTPDWLSSKDGSPFAPERLRTGIWNMFDANNMEEGEYFPTVPTRVYAKFEPI